MLQFIANLVLCMYVFFFSSFVCISANANVYRDFKTTIIKPNTAGVPSSQALRASLLLHLHLCAFRLYSVR